MEDSILLGVGRHTLRIPPTIWRRRVRGEAKLNFMSEDHHRVREFVVKELPRVAKPLPPSTIAGRLDLPEGQVVALLNDLEQHMTFLFRDEHGAVSWAYPVTVDETPIEALLGVELGGEPEGVTGLVAEGGAAGEGGGQEDQKGKMSHARYSFIRSPVSRAAWRE